MDKFYITFICFHLAALCTAVPKQDQIALSVELIDDLNAYLVKHPESEITPFRSEVIPIPPFATRYVFGRRVKGKQLLVTKGTIYLLNQYCFYITGDRILANRKDTFNYPKMRDVRLDLHYPQYGTGGIVSLVEINVKQTSDVGRAYIVAGGIGQRQIKFVVEARDVYAFSANTTIYGY